MATRSVLGLLCILKGLRDLGEDISPILTRYSLNLDTLDPSSRIDRDMELHIYVDLANLVRDPMSGLRAGTYIGFAGYGPLTMLFMTAGNAYEAIQCGIRYQQLTYLYGSLRFEPGPELSALALTPLQLPGKAFRFRVDGEVSGTYKLLRDMQGALGVNIHAQRIDMPYPRPPEAAAYESYLNCPVSFGGTEARFWMRNEHLHFRFPTADPVAHQFYRSQCEQQLQALASAAPERLADKVSTHLSLFTEGYPDAAAVAKAFGMAERSLRRQLSHEQVSFRGLLEGVRYNRARELLGTRLPVEEIARQLGYSESSSFIHAFQRWAGQSPAAWRRHSARITPESSG